MNKRQIPKGFRDLLPQEVRIKRELEKRVAELLQSYGYVEIITPVLERLEVIETGTGRNIREDLFLLTDREGGVLSLRPEMTVPIARMAATHLRDEKFPQRLFYLANVFRYVQPNLAHYREFWQAGIELLGASGPWADAEVIILAVKSLLAAGFSNFKISINHIGIINSVLYDSGLTQDQREQIRALVEKKDLVRLHRVLDILPIEAEKKETLAQLPILHGSIDTIKKIPFLEKNFQALKAAGQLTEIYEVLRDCGIEEYIVIDMGVLRGLNYYTGVVFEGYSPELGYGLLGGGRYDNLMGQFGAPASAVGFSMGLERLALVVPQPPVGPPKYVIGGRDFMRMHLRAETLRKQGFIAEMDLEGLSEEAFMAKWKEQNRELLFLD
ncbi:MAG: ATP phosphoribosyltransferase regulatory subunit [Syntrophomonadaceae bacterium]|jgi:ATP phosphoribosyltransferase regulatory subunit|nr:ATP phosphoribosyltransferase regulatory subunit [Syntrophomonadaceae bacterium]